jgi:hypothetical protein
MFKTHRGTHTTTWFHRISQEFEIDTQGWMRGLHWWQELREKGGKREGDTHQRVKGEMHLDAAGEEIAGEEGWLPARKRSPETESRGWPEGRK